MFGETTIFYIKIWNHPIETTIYKWLFGVPGKYTDLTTGMRMRAVTFPQRILVLAPATIPEEFTNYAWIEDCPGHLVTFTKEEATSGGFMMNVMWFSTCELTSLKC